MITVKKLFLFVIGGSTLLSISIFSYLYSNEKYTKMEEEKNLVEMQNEEKNSGKTKKDNFNKEDLQSNISATDIFENKDKDTKKEILKEGAILHFKKKYKNGKIVEDNIDLPNYLIGKDKNYITQSFNTYDLIKYSSYEVVFEKTINTESYYLIGEEDGYVCVFFVDIDESVKLQEKLDTPVKTLSQNDQELLKNGIRFDDEQSMLYALENYNS